MSQKYYDEYLRHMIAFEMFGNTLKNKTEKELLDLEEICEELLLEKDFVNTKTELTAITNATDSVIDDFTDVLAASMFLNITNIVNEESEWLKKIEKKYLGFDIKIPARVESIVKNLPFVSSQTVSSFTKSINDKLKQIYKGSLNQVYVLGGDINSAVQRIKPQIKTVLNSLKKETVTLSNAAVRNTDKVIFLANPKLKQKYVWCSSLDSSVCLVCGNFHGAMFDSLSSAPPNPIHENCRCFIMPVSENTKFEMTDYSDWIKKQPASIQKEILGKTRYEYFKQGMPVDKFVNNEKKLNLEELKAILEEI